MGAALLFLAALTLWLSWPRLQASLHYLPVDTALGRYFETRELPGAQLQHLRARAREAIALHDHYRYWHGLSLLHYLQALDPATPAWERAPELRRALSAGLQAVRRAPVSPYGWLQVAQARSALRDPAGAVIEALEMSLLTGRVEPVLLLPRVELGFLYLPEMNDAQRAQLSDQTALAWRANPGQFLRSVREGRLDLAMVRELLATGHADMLEALEKRLDPSA